MYYIVTPTEAIPFSTYPQLLNYVASKNYIFEGITYNSLMEHFGCNSNDKIGDTLLPRDHRVYDAYGRSLYNHEFIANVREWRYSEQITKELRAFWSANKKPFYRFSYHYSRENPRFRIDPVPFTGRHWGRGSMRGYYRHFHYARDRRLAARDSETRTIRAKRNINNLLSPWDLELVRSDYFDCSWKRQTKNRHQWQKNLD